MIHKLYYPDLGLVNTREMFQKARRAGTRSRRTTSTTWNSSRPSSPPAPRPEAPGDPAGLRKGARSYADATLLPLPGRREPWPWPATGGTPSLSASTSTTATRTRPASSCIESGFSSVMIDGSHLPFEENVALTRQVVEFARRFDVTVEGELGVLAGIEDEVHAEKSHYTRPEEVEEFVRSTGADSLAISIGTSHGAYKFKVKSQDEVPPLRFDILAEVERRIPGFPIVLHGASRWCRNTWT